MTAEQRAWWDENINLLRPAALADQANGYVEEAAGALHLVAVADHLAACEALLREIGWFHYAESAWSDEILREWQERARALLGPAEAPT